MKHNIGPSNQNKKLVVGFQYKMSLKRQKSVPSYILKEFLSMCAKHVQQQQHL